MKSSGGSNQAGDIFIGDKREVETGPEWIMNKDVVFTDLLSYNSVCEDIYMYLGWW